MKIVKKINEDLTGLLQRVQKRIEDGNKYAEENLRLKDLINRLYIARNISMNPRDQAWKDLDREGRAINENFN